MSHSQAPFIIIDGSSYLFRAYHGMPELTNREGEPTGAIYGVINMLKKIISDYQPSNIAVVFDAKGKNFRHEMYPEYKAHRPPMPDDLRCQIEPLHAMIQAMGLPLLMVDDVEADDVLATLARQAEKKGWRTLIATGDKDMAQVVDNNTAMLDTMKDIVMGPDGVLEKFGVPPEKIIDYLAMVGDRSDNIPGVPSVGPKTAVKWLGLYGSLDQIIVNADQIKGKVGERLRESIELLELSRKLVTVREDVPLSHTLEQLQMGPVDVERLAEYYRQYGFRKWERELHEGSVEGETTRENTIQKDHYETVTTDEQLEQWSKKLQAAELFCFDLETTSLDTIEAKIVGIALAVEGAACYIPVAHEDDSVKQLALSAALAMLQPYFNDASKGLVGHNLKYDLSVLINYAIEIKCQLFDTMLESYIVDSSAGRHDMDSVAQRVLEHKTISYEDVAGKGAKQIPFSQVTIEKAALYAAEDVDVTLRIHQSLWPQIEETEDLKVLCQTIETPLITVLMRMERLGVGIDREILKAQSEALRVRLEDIQQQAFDLAGEAFNLDSPKQIQAILYEKQELPVRKKTPKGQPSTAESVLQELAYDFPLPRLILEYRSLNKLRTTYTDSLPQRIHPQTGRVHTSYHQAVAATGRLSSSEPNLQNIPIRTEEGRAIRQAFVAPEGYRLIAADYSQIELRILAHLSEDETLIEAFKRGDDIHKATAAGVFDCALDEVSSEQRRRAKAINFGIIYGMSAFGLAKQLGVDRTQAQFFIDEYFMRYPCVKDFLNGVRTQAKEQGYVQTVFGRRLYLPEIRSSNHQRKLYAERAAINAPMQGTAADIIKRAMIDVDRWIRESGEDIRMIMQVHDELVLEVRTSEAERLSKQVAHLMKHAAQLKTSLEVDVGIGMNWSEAH